LIHPYLLHSGAGDPWMLAGDLDGLLLVRAGFITDGEFLRDAMLLGRCRPVPGAF